MPLSDKEVAALRIFNAYRDEMNQRQTLPRNFPAQMWQLGPRVQKYFLTAGASCVQYGMDPEEYVRIAFSKALMNQNYITPKDIVSSDQVVKAMLYQQQAGLRVPAEWTNMVKGLKTRAMRMVPAQYEDEIAILMDPMQPFTGWFRVLYPDEIYECLFEAYSKLAHSELASDRKLRAFLRKERTENLEKFERITVGFGDALLEGSYDG
jgi:hypothetical protein